MFAAVMKNHSSGRFDVQYQREDAKQWFRFLSKEIKRHRKSYCPASVHINQFEVNV